MIRPYRPLRSYEYPAAFWRLARSGPGLGALSAVLSALDRRRHLRRQQQRLGAGTVDYLARPPYPYRPRPFP